jgi:hypothetical protein
MSALLPIVSILISIVSLSWAVFVTLRKGDLARPTLKFYLGVTGPAKKIGKQKLLAPERRRLSTLILVGKLEKNEIGVFPIHFGIQNTSKTPAKNVQIILSYPQEFLLKDLSFFTELDFADKRTIRINPETKERSVSTAGGMAHVVYEYSLMRPREGIMTFEPAIFQNPTQSPASPHQQLEDLPLKSRMRYSGVTGYFTLDVFVTAENSRPTTKRFNVVWLNEEVTDKNVDDILEQVAQGFWGKFATPGLYGKLFWEKLSSDGKKSKFCDSTLQRQRKRRKNSKSQSRNL